MFNSMKPAEWSMKPKTTQMFRLPPAEQLNAQRQLEWELEVEILTVK